MTVTRDIINKNILFRDFKIEEDIKDNKITEYSFNELSNLIDCYKNILQTKFKVKSGESVLIGEPPNIHQISLFFACAELGLEIIIADNKISNLKYEDFIKLDKTNNNNYIDPKTKILLPIDYLITKSNYSNKMEMYKLISANYVDVNNYDNIVSNNNVECSDNNVLLRCTSSGTTGTAKLVKHTHQFIKNISHRNKVFFNDNVGIMRNLNHGSSIATYFLPSLMSENVKTFNNFNFTNNHRVFSYDYIKYNINHLMLPYPSLVDMLIEKFVSLGLKTNLILYTLSTINKKNLIHYKNKTFSDIISFFGSNETSGPVFINNVSDLDFQESKYKLFDDYYQVSLSEQNILHVKLPIYNTTVSTNDIFETSKNRYIHMGRSDLYRINELEVDIEKYKTLVVNNLNGELIVDTNKNSIYLAIWSDYNDIDIKINNISKQIETYSEGLHKINKFKVLNKDTFLSGVKLDNELLRDYFRNYV